MHYAGNVYLSKLVAAALTASLLLAGCDSRTAAIGHADSVKSAAAVASASGPYRPTATFQDIMDSIVDSSADFIWHSVSSTVDATGIHEHRPQSDVEWHEVRRRAIQLVEAANLIAVPGRTVASGNKTIETGEVLDVKPIQQRLDARHDELVGFAAALRDVGLKLANAAEQKNVEGIVEFGGVLDEVCEACHKTFWYPDQR